MVSSSRVFIVWLRTGVPGLERSTGRRIGGGVVVLPLGVGQRRAQRVETDKQMASVNNHY